MNDLFIKLIELRTKLITYSKLVDSTRELGISSSLFNFIELLENTYPEFDINAARYSTTLIAVNSHPQELRENLLTNLIATLSDIKDTEVNPKIGMLLIDMLILEQLYKDTMISRDMIVMIDAFRGNYTTLKTGLPGSFLEIANLVNDFYEVLKHHIDLIGVTIQQVEKAATETGNGDYSCGLTVKLLDFNENHSEFRKIIVLVQIYIIVSSITNIFD